ncbi:HAMP domain-containing protein, partial [bacterium]|nr:HAMP domain-containing protein [bacterium]
MKLRTKFSLLIAVLVVFLLLITTVVLFVFEKSSLIKEISQKQIVMVGNLGKVSRDCLMRKDFIFLINYLKTIKGSDEIVSFALFTDERNKVLAHTDPEFIRETLTDEFSQRAFESDTIILRNFQTKTGEKIIEYAAPVKFASDRIGTARIGFSTDIIDSNISSALSDVRKRILTAGILSFAVGLLVIFLISASIVKPVRLLTRGAELIGEGKLDTKINLKTGDEFALLAEKFNWMSAKLKELDEMKRDFTSSVTHELRSPLGAIETYINKMLDGGEDGFRETGVSDLFIMKNNAARLARFIDDLLDAAKIESGRMEVDAEFFKLLPVVGDLAEFFTPQAAKKDVEIAVHITRNLPAVYADKERVRQVFINLISNALKFTPSGGKITVSASFKKPSDFVNILVKDTGEGIPAQDLKYIFDKFRQVKGGKQSVKGTGLGLFIVKSI